MTLKEEWSPLRIPLLLLTLFGASLGLIIIGVPYPFVVLLCLLLALFWPEED